MVNKVFCGLTLFLKKNITVFAVVFLLSCVSVANASSSYNFQVGSILFTHLDGKGSSGSEKEDIIVRDTEIRSASESYIPIVKIISTTRTMFFIHHSPFKTSFPHLQTRQPL